MTAGSAAPSRLSGTNLERTADHNQRVTLPAIRVSGACTRNELAEITGLTAPTVANITRRLLDDGLIETTGKVHGPRGQPAIRFAVRSDACFSIGVCVDRDDVSMVLIDFAGETLARRSSTIAAATPGQIQAYYRGSVGGLLRSAGVAPDRILGVGVALPDDPDARATRSGGAAAWDGIDVQALFAAPFGRPVFTHTPVAAAALGEMQLGLGQRHDNFFYILIGATLGGGLIVDGNFVGQANGRGADLAAIAGPPHASAKTIEASVSRPGLVRHLETHGFGIDDISADAAACTRVWIARAAEQLIPALIAINGLLNPAILLVGGLPEQVLDGLVEQASDRLRFTGAMLPATAPIARAALAPDSAAVGAAILPIRHHFLPKPGTLWKAPTLRERERRESIL